MSVLDKESIFTSMLQDGPFSIGDNPPAKNRFSKETREWVRGIYDNPLLKTKYRIVRNQIYDFLGIGAFNEIQNLLCQAESQKLCSQRASRLLGNMFGIQGSDNEVSKYIKDYARTANDVINSLRNKVLSPYASHIEMTNEIETRTDPVDLLLIIFNDHFHKKARFEAKRKLQLMILAGSIDQRERDPDRNKIFFLSGLSKQLCLESKTQNRRSSYKLPVKQT